jgi:hypothetical protein
MNGPLRASGPTSQRPAWAFRRDTGQTHHGNRCLAFGPARPTSRVVADAPSLARAVELGMGTASVDHHDVVIVGSDLRVGVAGSTSIRPRETGVRTRPRQPQRSLQGGHRSGAFQRIPFGPLVRTIASALPSLEENLPEASSAGQLQTMRSSVGLPNSAIVRARGECYGWYSSAVARTSSGSLGTTTPV